MQNFYYNAQKPRKKVSWKFIERCIKLCCEKENFKNQQRAAQKVEISVFLWKIIALLKSFVRLPTTEKKVL